jgi:hypothetical protein
MHPVHRREANALLADAADTKIDREDVLGRLTALGRVLGGDDRHELGRRVYDILDRRPT